MESKIARFLEKHSILPEEIKYIVREEGETVVYTIDDRKVRTYHPVKEFRAYLPVEDFLYPNKGIVAAASQIVSLKDGGYEMTDGRVFKCRVHNSQLHDSRLLNLGRQFEHAHVVEETCNSFSMLDKFPLPVCVLELDMEEGNFNANFLLRYSNAAALAYEGLDWEQVKERSVSELITFTDVKWMVIFMDVALNDSVRTIVHYDKRRDIFIKMYCFQPLQGYCACVLTELESRDALEEEHFVSETDL